MKRFIIIPGVISLVYSIIHMSLNGLTDILQLLLNLLVSFTYFSTICLVWHIGEQSKKTRFLNIIASAMFLLPSAQIAYYMTYKGFISAELYSFILRELSFLWEMILTGLSLTNLIGAITILTANYYFFRWILKIRNKGIDYLFLFKKWYILLLLIGVEIQQIAWCIKRDTSRLPERIMIPITVVFVLSALIRALKYKRATWKKVTFIGIALLNLFINIFFSRSPLTKLRDSSTLDTQFFQSTFAAVYNGNPVKFLTQEGEALDALKKLPDSKLDYNVIIILVDALRYDALTVGGHDRNTDKNLQWFYPSATLFEYAISPTNMTDTSLPTIFTGVGTDKNVSTIKNSLRMWDYYKGADTFYYLTADVKFANIDKFLDTKGMKSVWSADDGKRSTLDIIRNGDEIAVNKVMEHIKTLNKNYVGVWHADGTHSYIKYPGPKEYLIFDRKNGKSEIEKRKINYDNSVHYSTTMVSRLLKSIDLDNTVVVITADHGEGFGEHGYSFHNQDYHQESVRVPFIWHIPRRIKNEVSKEKYKCFEKNAKSVVSVLDLVPTLLGLHKEVTGVDLFVNPHAYTGKNLFECQPENRVVFSSHCLNGYRCYKRNILFASNDYSVIYDTAKGIEGIYSTFDDISQKEPIELNKVNKNQKFINVIEKASDSHPIGRLLHKYIQQHSNH